MFFTQNWKISKVSALIRVWLCTFIIIITCTAAYSHGTQTAYCITDQGRIRVWIEHWHGNITPAQVTNALVSIDVTDTSTGMTTNFQQIPDGVVFDTTVDNLPDCKGPMNILSTCPGRANVYNDWVYWEFVPPACFVNLTVTIVEVIGSQSFYFDEPCAQLYPVSFTDSFIDCVPPSITCPANQTIEVNAGGCGANVTTTAPTILFDDCTAVADIILDYTVTGATTASGTGNANIFFNKGTSTVTYSATDEVPSTATCSFTITIVDNTPPAISCPSNLTIECNASAKGVAISNWLNTVTATDDCGISSITNDFDPDGFAYQQEIKKNNYTASDPRAAYGSLALANINSSVLMDALFNCSTSIDFSIQEMKGENKYDYPVKIRLDKSSSDFVNIEASIFTDAQNRLMPHWVEKETEKYADVWVKIPELQKYTKSAYAINYGVCKGVEFTKEDVFGTDHTLSELSDEKVKPFILGKGISNTMFLKEKKAEENATAATPMMDCNCTASQGAQSFPVNALQNAEDAVSFYSFGTPNGASANTGLEMNDAVVLFLYENTLTGEISLFIIIDGVGGGNGGAGSIDFFCLPSSATLDLSDDNGEISGIFPTVTANWRWANCCTDGALIGNVGCNSTFDFFPAFTSGINSMKWVSGTLASPVYTTFNNFTDPVRIQCGTGQPECCPNANTVNTIDASCPTTADGSIDLVVDASGAPYTYAWSTGATTQDVSNLLPGDYEVTVTDVDNCEQIIEVTIESEELPQLVCTADQTIIMESDSIDVIAGTNVFYTVDYDCPDNVTVTCDGCDSYGCADANSPFPVTFTVTDVLGNTDECVVMVTLQNDGPQLSCPNDLNIECNLSGKGATISDWLETVSSTDADDVVISNDFDPDGFSFIDLLGSSSDIAYQSPSKLSVQTAPEDFYLDLSSVTSSTMLVGDSATGSQIVTFTATDNCGNTSTCTATINIVDTEDPVITCPSDLTVECGDPNSDATIATWLGTATANDACDLGVVVTNNYADASFAGGCNVPTGTRVVTFTATDCDGNRATCQASITRDDTTAPVFLIPPTDITVDCIDVNGNTPEINAWLASNAGGIASDECDTNITWSRTTGTRTDLCGDTFTQDYTFTITDDCGNSNSATVTATVEDITPPIMNAPVDRLLNCVPATNEASLEAFLGAYSASDACSPNANVDVTFIQNSFEQLCGGTYRETYLYTATDECGNTSTDLFTFEVRDVTIPTFAGLPGTLVLECGDIENPSIIAQWIDNIEDAMFDTCDDSPLTFENNWDGNLSEGCNQNTVIAFSTTDGCGNTRTFNRTIAVRDTADPEFISCPVDFTVNVDVDECGSNVTFPTPVAFDQCTPQNELTITQINGPASGSSFPVGTTFVRFELRDGCNRRDLCAFNITVEDTDEPSVSCPSNVEVCVAENTCLWRSDASVLPITNENCPTLTIQVEITGATVLTRRTGNASNRNFQVGTSTVCYFLTDGAGNETECCFDVIVSDCQDPDIICPADITNAVCGATPPASFTATARDNCTANADIVITSMLFNTISDCGGTETQVYQFTATDEAGNTSQCFANFTTVDNVVPVITTPATAGASDCDSADIDLLDWLNNNGGAEANDACGSVTWSYEFVGGATTGCSGAPSVNVTFTATDECGNTATTAAAFNVDDTVAPTISCPSDITLECGDVLNDSVIELWLGLASGDDNCSDVTITNDFPADPMLDCDGMITVTFTATDACGNDTECEATITMEDVTPPAFTVLPEDITLECGDPGNSAAMAQNTRSISNAVFSDQCTSDLSINVEQVGDTPTCGLAGILEYEVTLTDECDNETVATWSINIEDTTPPVLSIPADATFTCDGSGNTTDIDAWLATATTTDMCGTATVESVLFNSTDACGNFENQSYLFTATDECGNVSTDIASVIIEDATAPVITCPADLTLSCGALNNSALVITWLEEASATDICSDVTIENNYTGLFPANCGGALTVTFIATDACGNTSSCTADIIMTDVATPDFENCPEDLTINVDVSNCGSNPIFSTPTAIDNCGVSVAQTAGPASGSPFPVGTTTVEFTATDECGNTQTCEFDITVIDSAEPLVLCPPTLGDRCITDGTCSLEVDGIAPVLGQENCPGFTITYNITGATTASGNDDASGTEFNLGVSTVCYLLTDAAGNESMCCFDIQVIDCTAPEIICPEDLTVQCEDEVSGTPAEGKLIWNHNDAGGTSYAGNNNAMGLISSVTDISFGPGLTLLNGNANPTTIPNGTNYEHVLTDVATNTFAGALANDDYVEIGFVVSNKSILKGIQEGIIPTAWGGSAAGSFQVAAEISNDGFATSSLLYQGAFIGDPNAAGGYVLYNEPTNFVLLAGQAYTVRFYLYDEQNNASLSNGIPLPDNTVAFDDLELTIEECLAGTVQDKLDNWLATASASDACSSPITFENVQFNTISGCGDTSSTIYEFTATDAAGNTAVCYAEFTIEDNTSPMIMSEAEDLTVECDGANNSNDIQSWLNSFGGAEATDGCGAVSFSHDFSGSLSDECAETGSITVIFTATDDCGNTATTDAVFTIEDTTAPVISCPNDIELECGDPVNDAVITNWLATATASDDCSDVSFTNDFETSFIEACGGTGIYTVTFTATDDCGNSSTCERSITITDNLLPTFSQEPQDLNLECADANNAVLYNNWLSLNGNGVALDDCGDVSWTVEELDAIVICGEATSTPHLWTITDDCGNISTAISSVVLEDTTAPEISTPADTTVECDGAGNTAALDTWLATVSGTDECGDITTDVILNNTTSGCGTSDRQTFIFTVTDDCGNETTGVGNFTIEDTTAPMITCPSNLSLECGAIGNDQLINAWLLSAEGTDVCGDVSITNDFSGQLPADCDGSVNVTFTSTDACGNTTSCVAVITMDDTTDPTFENCPEDLMINVDVDACGSNPIFSTPIADDNCTVTVAQTAGPASGTTFPVGTTAIEFTATDGCGNTAICQFNIIVIDSDVPQIFCPSTTVTQCTDSGLCTWNSDASVAPSTSFENCDDYTITYTITGATSAAGSNSAAGEVFELGVSTVCYTITDVSDNSSTCCFDVLLEDCEAPSLVCPNDLIVECAVSNELDLNSWLNSAVSSDNCDAAANIEFTLFNTISGCGGASTEEYLITATDLAGNQTSCIVSFEIQDNTAPVINTTVPDMTVECDGLGNTDQLIAWVSNNGNIPDANVSEFCSDFNWQNNFGQVSFTSTDPCLGYYEVQFWVEDECDNASNIIAKRFIIEDTSEPIIEVPADLMLECGDPLNEALINSWLADVQADDVCDAALEITNTTSVIAQCGNTNTTIYTFTATDACGNSEEASAQIIMVDTQAPEITVEASDLELECAGATNDDLIDAWEDSFGGAQATDDCSDEALEWSIQDEISQGTCGDGETILYVFVVEDNCGNTSTTSASVIIMDNTDPVLTLPVDQIEECGAEVVSITDWLNEATATDDCGTADITSALWDTQSGCGATDTEVYLFTATDECGNTSTGLARYTLEDTAVPIITCPANLILECGDDNNDQLINAWLNSAFAIDANGCSDVVLSFDYPNGLPDPLTCNGGTGTVVVFTATDDCGNTSTCMASILMNDTVDPYFVDCPSNLMVNVDVDLCASNVVFSSPIALDDCDDMVSVVQTAGPASGTAFPLGASQVTFVATDICGNTSSCSFQITVVDSDTPSIDCPSNDVVKCADTGSCTWAADDDVDPLFNDNCTDLTLTYSISGATTETSSATGTNTVSGDMVVFELGLSTVTYTLTDGSGNTSTCSFDVLIEDCEDPSLTCSDDFDIACGEEDISGWFETIAATAFDNCDALDDLSVDTLLIEQVSSCGSTFERTYLFTVTDQAGNTSTCVATYETDDEVAPIIDVEAEDLTLECNGGNQSTALQAWLNNNAGASASDVCSGPVTWTNSFTDDLATTCGANGSLLVVFTATDDCGNTSTTEATFTIQDTTAPTLELPVDIVLECSNSLNDVLIENWLLSATAEDDCQGTIQVTHDFETAVAIDLCGLTGVTTVTFTATDDCDNVTVDTRTITIEDNTSPTIDVEASDLILECADAGNAAAIAAFEASFGGAVASDECSDEDLIWSILSQDVLETCGTSTTTEYVFQVSDNCGNTSTTSASIIIEDTTMPVLTLPENQVEECAAVMVDLDTWLGEATATDDCGTVEITSVLWNSISDCGATELEEYLFTATDECGNSTTGIASYQIVDTSAPLITCPADLILECGDLNNDQRINFWLESAMEMDAPDCNEVEITYSYPGSLPDLDCTGTAGITVTFIATDDCGNTSSCTAMIILNDTTIPVFQTCPGDMTVNVDVDLCENNVVYSTPTAFDNCDDDLTITQTAGPLSGTAFPIGTSTVTFVVEDDCGNSSECSFDITVIDSDVPSIACPSNEVVVCADDGTCAWTSDDKTNPIFNDNCDGLIVTYEITGATTATSGTTDVNTVEDDGVIFNLGSSTVCYTITDASANSSSCCFDVIVEDCEDPTITCSDVLDVACGSEDLSAWFDAIAATITDNCSAVADMSVDTLLLTDFSSCGNTFERVYLFTVTDEAGNTSTCTASYETDDEVAPVIDVPAADLTLECNGGNQSTALQAWLNNNGGAQASDACSEPITWSNDFLGDLTTTCGTNGNVEVIFTATDDCGNTSTTSAIFTIEDTTSPEISLPVDLTLECADGLNTAVINNWLNSATAEDDCSGTLTIVNDFATAPSTDLCGLTGVTTITFTVTDDCDNSTTDTRTLTLEDNTAPEITVEPTNLELECSGADNAALIEAWEADFGGAEGTDSCSDEDLVWSILNMLPFGNCGDTQSTLYTFQLTDNCGNTSITTASVIVEDTTAPELTVPVDVVVECNDEMPTLAVWLATVSATDDCGDVETSSFLNNTISACGGTYMEVYIFTATDACGNQTTGTAEYSLEDTTSPEITCPEDLILNCGNPNNDLIILQWLESATATDVNGCSSVDLDFTDPGAMPALDCSGSGGSTITWTATDECGNTSTCQALIIVEDNEDPVFVNCPADMTINVDVDQCSSNPIFSTPIADDNCSVTVAQVANADGTLLASGTSFPIGTTEVVFVATDICGNTAVCSFDITVEDSDVPIVLCPSNTIEVSTDPSTCTWVSDGQVSTAFSVENCPDQTLIYDITGATTASGLDNAEGEIFELGLSTVCYTLTDAAGNASMCCFDVLVTDDEMPMMTCPADVTISTSDVIFGDCLSDYDWTHPAITDNCMIVDATLELAMQSPTGVLTGPNLVVSGGVVNNSFELGTTTLTYVLTDENGNINTCEWTVTVEDDEVPMITCPVDMTFEINDDCQYTETTDQLDPVTSDNCGLDLLAHDYIFAPSSNTLAGASFDIGTTTVTYVVFDESGNSSSCDFNITVEDNEVPEFVNCPQDTLVVGNDVDQCSAFVNWSDPIAMDECGVVVAQTAGPNSGDELAPGFYTITYVATDNNGNTTICEFVIHVQDTQMPIVLCPSNDVVVDTDLGTCTWTSPAGSLAATTALTNCPFDLTWTVTNPDGFTDTGDEDVSGYIFELGTSVVCYDVIEQDDPDNNGLMSDQCCFNVIVEDNESPLVTCQDDITINTSAGGTGDCLANYEWNHPIPTDNCGIALVFVTVTDADGIITGPLDVAAGDNMIFDFPLGTSTIVYDIEDENGNASTCQFTVTVEDDEVPMIECVADVLESVDENCQYVVLDDALDPTFSDNCNIDLSYHDYIFAPNSGTLAGAKFELGQTEIIWTVVDDFGNSSTCTHTVTTEDTSAPMITNCPANPIVQDADSGSCEAIVNFSNIAAEDNCGGLSTVEYMLAGEITLPWTLGQASGITYPVGTTTVSYRANDQFGNVSEVCEFDIVVVDNMDPVAVCQDIEIGVDFNCMASITPEDIDAGSTDNCGIDTLLISTDGINFFDELNFVSSDLTSPFVNVTLMVVDNFGNESICQSTVFIIDEINPMVICQDDIIVPTEPGVCFAMVPNVIPPIDTTDNCMGIANVRQEPLPGLLFGSEVGDSMFVTVIVEDEAGNMDSCEVKLVIEDNEIPQFTNCPRPPVTAAAETDLCAAAVNFSIPTGTDNCGNPTINRLDDTGLDSGDWFPIGTTILSYEIVDGSGNADTCHIKVIVNDLQPPEFNCPGDVLQVNDPGFCGAIVKDIDPENIMDNCMDELTVTFAVDHEGIRDNGGVIEASGEYFQVGNNVVTYCLEDRPTIVISEVTHEIGAAIGANSIPSYFDQGLEEDYIEITNVGPSTVDVSCLVVEKLIGSSGGFGSFTVPFNTFMAPGDVMVVHVGPGTDSPADLYYNMDVGGSNAGDFAGYALMYGECALDVVALNGFNANGAGELVTIGSADWSGVIASDSGTAGVYRPFSFDGNNSIDWAVIDDANPGSIAKVNPGFDVYPDSGLTSSLQSKCGNKICCSFVVEIVDTEPPSIVCPDDLTINTSDNGTGDCMSSTSWRHPDIDDNCGTSRYCMTITTPDSMVIENCTIIPGVLFTDEFETGDTHIEYAVEDEAGNRSTCTFTVTVLDDEDPAFTCPSDLFIQLGAGECFVNVFNQINLFETDNCGDMTMTSTPDMDGQFSEGENVVNIVVSDAAGNERNCSFMITVAEFVPSSTEMACQGTVNVSLNADCEATITPEMILVAGEYGCLDDLEISLSETHGGDPIPTSPMVNSDHINMSLVVTIFNPLTGNSCWGTVLIEDKLVPEIECLADITVSCAEGVEPATAGMPVLTSCEGSIDMIFTDEIIDNGLCGTPRAIHTRTWIVTDEAGNSSSCTQTITVEGLDNTAVECPLNFDDVDNPSMDCDAVAANPLLIHPDNTGRPTINGAGVTEAEYCPLSVNMSDELFDLCEGSYDILRTWRIYDPCRPVVKEGPDRNPVHCIQVIKVRDNTAPVITCPDDMVVSVNSNSCRADIQFLPASITEACGSVDVQIISPFGSLNTNGGMITDIAIGDFAVRYIATDGCGNQSECSMNVSVMDEIQPVAVCNPDVIVSLNSAGVAEVPGEAFDQGSSDNCAIDQILVRRMTTDCGIDADLEFGESVTFCCADVGNVVMVQMRVYDAVGNFNECMVEATIDDKQDAEITCPPDIIVDCGTADYQDLNFTGMATFTDNCTGNLGMADFVDQEFIDQCGNGHVLRTWSVGTASCVQRIDLVDPQPFFITDTTCENEDPNDGVIWPCDVEIESCSQMQDPNVTGEVQIFDDNCSLTGIDFEDQVFTFEDDACFKIVRTWQVIDWCTYDPNTGEGFWEYQQVIKIINSMPPTISNCDLLEVCTVNDACNADVVATITGGDDCTAVAELSYTYQLDIGNDGTFNESGVGNTVSETLDIGTHRILWSVEDGCGNITTCTQMIQVNDCKLPTAYCLNGLSTTIGAGKATVTILATMFDNGSEDNCTAQEDLQISFSSDVNNTSMTFSCADLPNGIQETITVEMWVTDEFGNQSFCTTNLLLQDLHDECEDVILLNAEIAGKVTTEEEEGVNEVLINVQNMDTGEPYNMMTDTIGTYVFPDPMPTENQYSIIPEKNTDHDNGLSALDLITIQRHLLGMDTLDSPYKLIAADINSSEHISSIDLIELQKLLLGVYDEFPNNTSWRFVSKDFVFVDPTDPWPYAEDRYIDTLLFNEMQEDFVGVKIGDVNGTVNPSMTDTPVSTLRSEISLKAKDRLLRKGNTERIEFSLSRDMDLTAVQFSMEAISDELRFVNIDAELLQIGGADVAYSNRDRNLSVLWYEAAAKVYEEDKILFVLEVEVLEDIMISEALRFNAKSLDALVIDENLESSAMSLELESEKMDFAVAQNVPNPFSDNTSFEISIPSPSDIEVNVYDALGRLVYSYSDKHDSSFIFVIEANDIGSTPGIYTYEVKKDDEVITNSMILIK